MTTGFTNGAVDVDDKDQSRINLDVPKTDGTGASGDWPISAANITVVDTLSGDAPVYPMWASSNSGSVAAQVSSTQFNFIPSIGLLAIGGGIVTNSIAWASGNGYVDIQNNLLVDNTPNNSIDWYNRKLYDINGNQTLDYSNNAYIQINGIQGNVVSNGSFGTDTLVAGTVTISNTSVTSNSRFLVTSQANTAIGSLYISSVNVGSDFTITSSLLTDTGNVFWMKVEIND